MSNSYQVSSIDPHVLATVNQELNKREELQHRHYNYLQQLQEFTRELPSKYQQRMSHDLLAGLASSLLDGTAFQIVSGMSELQRMEEETLINHRKAIVAKFVDEKKELLEAHTQRLHKCDSAEASADVEEENRKELQEFDDRRREEIIKNDRRIINRLDAKLLDQQVTLMKAGVVGFHDTIDPDEVRLQMYLLDFVLRLSAKENT